MSIVTYNLTNWEQGSINTSGDTSSSSRIRTPDYIELTPNATVEYKVTAVDTNGNSLRWNPMLYNASKQCIRDGGWQNSGTTWTNTDQAKYVRFCLSYSSGDISPSNLGSCIFEYNDMMNWYVINGELTNTNFIDDVQYAMTQPYPKELWRVGTGGILTHELLPNKIDLGAFANATQLRQISIPKSCKKIGKEAFRNTQLASVTIASDCTYYDTSFPEGCAVNFYPD